MCTCMCLGKREGTPHEELLEELLLLLELLEVLLLELLEVLLLDDGVHAENKPLLAVRVESFWSYSIMQIR